MRRTASSIAVILFLLSSAVPLAMAADVPSRETAGAEESRFREADRRDAQAPSSDEATPIVDKQQTPVSSGGSELNFYVKEIRFSGNYSIPDARLLPLAEPILNKTVSLADVERVVAAMKDYYRKKGFIAAFVYVPPQQVPDGVLKIDVMEGRFGALKISGSKMYSEKLLRKMSRLKTGDVLRFESLRRDLARLNATGNVDAKAVLAPGDAPGTTDVVIEIKENHPLRVSTEANNSGAASTGKYRYGLNASHHNLTGRMDTLSAAIQHGKGVDSFTAGYEAPISYQLGLKAGYVYTHADVDVGGAFKALEVTGRAETHRVYLSQPLLERPSLDVDGVLGMDRKHVENKVLGQISGQDDLTAPNLELNFKQNDPGGIAYLSNRFNFGIANFFGSSEVVNPIASRPGTGSDYFTYRATAMRLQKLPAQSLLSVRGTLQLSGDALSPSEQISIGGAKSVRGYGESDYLADHGGFVSVDLYIPAGFLPDSWRLPLARQSLKKDLQGILFADAGVGNIRRPLTGEKKSKTLSGIGAGFRAHLYDQFYGRFEWAFPVGDEPFDGRAKAFYFTVSYEV